MDDEVWRMNYSRTVDAAMHAAVSARKTALVQCKWLIAKDEDERRDFASVKSKVSRHWQNLMDAVFSLGQSKIPSGWTDAEPMVIWNGLPHRPSWCAAETICWDLAEAVKLIREWKPDDDDLSTMRGDAELFVAEWDGVELPVLRDQIFTDMQTAMVIPGRIQPDNPQESRKSTQRFKIDSNVHRAVEMFEREKKKNPRLSKDEFCQKNAHRFNIAASTLSRKIREFYKSQSDTTG